MLDHPVLVSTVLTDVSASLTRILKNTVTLQVLFKVPVGMNTIVIAIIYLKVLLAGACDGVRH